MRLILVFSLLLHPLIVSCTEKEVYIVYLGKHKGDKTLEEIQESHYSYLLLVKERTEEATSSLIYHYKHSINGFAALLTAQEAFILSEREDVISVFKSHPRRYTLQTTRSWKFMGLEGLNDEKPHDLDRFRNENDLLSKASYGKDIIIGIIDTGIWPESKSFSPRTMHIPKSWKGTCNITIDFNSTNCNSKIIGAKYYLDGFETKYGPLDVSEDSRSPRDVDGHGTHIASIAGGRTVMGVGALGGFAFGTASGGAPMSHLAIYKVCWRLPKNPQEHDCCDLDILAAIDDAISDGVHVINISLTEEGATSYEYDAISIGALHATEKNIPVICAGGNFGPELETASNVAPWMLTTGSGSIDRAFVSTLTLNNNVTIMGRGVSPYEPTSLHTLVYARDAEKLNVRPDEKGKCLGGSLLSELSSGKIVICDGNEVESNEAMSIEVQRVGGVGVIIVVDTQQTNFEGFLANYPNPGFPAILLDTFHATKVFDYISRYATFNARASFGRARTMHNTRPSPSVAKESGRGPNRIDPHIIKPDLIAPGINILAAWSEATPITTNKNGQRYDIFSGTSMAAPHVAAIIALLKAIHPYWSSAAIRSALMTSASMHNNVYSHITDYNGEFATPFSFGSGHLTPTKAVNPGLVYNASFIDYLTYLCNVGLKKFVASFNHPTFSCASHVVIPSYHLNYPSLAITNITKSAQVVRTVTNVGDPKTKYVFLAKPPRGFIVKATPAFLIFDHVGQEKSFNITITVAHPAMIDKKYDYSFGWYAWCDNFHFVRSQIMVTLA